MFRAQGETLLGTRIPMQLKERLQRYCLSHGIKMNYFVSEAIREKLQEIRDDRELTAAAKGRLKTAKFISQKKIGEYLSKRKIKFS